MKCCGSPTTSTVLSRAAAPSHAREVAAQFDALLAGAVFKPLASAMGFYGDFFVNAAALTIARSERGGLTDRLERAIEDATRRAPESSR